MRGHGRSGQPLEAEAYQSLRYAEDFKTVCGAFGVDKPFLVGWSLGGSSSPLSYPHFFLQPVSLQA
ncbi:hypothetical protein V8D89_007901 [Ganoderma adspersum]